jgi:hypothetical protein
MSNPKEKAKAKELIDKFYKQIEHQDLYWDIDAQAKQCALIAVDEIWNALESERVFEVYDYWQQVKQEINDL